MSSPTVLLQEQIERAEALKHLPKNSPQYKIWCNTTTRIIREQFTDEYADIFARTWSPTPRHATSAEARRAFLTTLDNKVQVLQAIKEEYTRLQAEPSIDITRSSSLQTYDFHKEIKAVSLRLYEDKHYAQAVEEAFKRVIKEVKKIVKDKTGKEYINAVQLMERAFCFSHQEPVIKFNQLQNKEDENEQQGIMLLFNGMVKIRNKKAHTNVILDDQLRATEYLSLASLLMRLLDQFAA